MTEFEKWNELEKVKITDGTREKLNEALDLLVIKNVREFVETIVMTKSSESKIVEALDIEGILIPYLMVNNRYHPKAPTKDGIAMIAAVLLHNIFFNPYDQKPNWRALFDLRAETQDLADELTDQENYGIFDWIFQIVEAQLGYEMPVQNCHPVPNQFTHLVWQVLWFYYNTDCSCVLNREDMD